MAKSDAYNNKKRRNKRKRRKRIYRILGMFAGMLTTGAILAGGYIGINYYLTTSAVNEPTLPFRITEDSEPATSADIETTVTSSLEQLTQEETSALISETESSSVKGTGESIEETESLSEAEPQETTEAEPVIEVNADEELRLKNEALAKYDNLGVVAGVNNYLNMRTAPSTDADICGKIFRYCGVNVLSDAGNGWYQIESGGVTGYVAQQYIKTGEEARELALEHMRYQAYVLTDTLDVMRRPSKNSDVITTIRSGDHYDIKSFRGSWVEIEAVEDLTGYVKASDISAEYHLEEAVVFGYDDSISQTRIDIINTAFEYYGNPYVFGGRDMENGIDCSAFTYTIYEMYGIDLVEMYSVTQSTVGVEVSEADIRPGDLLFYVGRYEGMIGHVAIYIGNDKIIHAASESKGVCVSDWKYVPIVTIRDVIGDR